MYLLSVDQNYSVSRTLPCYLSERGCAQSFVLLLKVSLSREDIKLVRRLTAPKLPDLEMRAFWLCAFVGLLLRETPEHHNQSTTICNLDEFPSTVVMDSQGNPCPFKLLRDTHAYNTQNISKQSTNFILKTVFIGLYYSTVS